MTDYRDFAIRFLISLVIILAMGLASAMSFFWGVAREKTKWEYMTSLMNKSIVYVAGKGQTWASIADSMYPNHARNEVVAVLQMLNGEEEPKSGVAIFLPKEF